MPRTSQSTLVLDLGRDRCWYCRPDQGDIDFGGVFHVGQFRSAVIRKGGVRNEKVLGATVLQIYSMLSFDFDRLVAVALFAAVLITYLAMERWLDGFAYRIEIGPGIFLTTGMGMLGITLATGGYQSIRTTLAHPVTASGRSSPLGHTRKPSPHS